VSGKYGEVRFVVGDTKIIEAVVNGKKYRIETNDVEYAINSFRRFIGSIGALLTPDLFEVEITKRGKVVIHLSKIFEIESRNCIIPFKTILPSGIELDIYIPATGIVKRHFIYVSK